MKKGYLYLIFLSLFLFLVFSLYFIYNAISPHSKVFLDDNNLSLDSEDLLINKIDIDNYAEDSWIKKISSKNSNHKDYQYPKQKFYMEFN